MNEQQSQMIFETDKLNGFAFKFYKDKNDKEPFAVHHVTDISKMMEMKRMIDGYIQWFEFWIGNLEYYNDFENKIEKIFEEIDQIKNTDTDEKYSFGENLALYTEQAKNVGNKVLYDNDTAARETLAKFKAKYPDHAPIGQEISDDYVYFYCDDRETMFNLYHFIYKEIIKPVLDNMLDVKNY